jgi:hypothetical protein
MCRGESRCVELGDNPNIWSTASPLRPPDWFKEEVKLFHKSVFEASKGHIDKAIGILKKIRDAELRNWYVEHGQMSGMFRVKILKRPRPVAENIDRDKLRSPDKFANFVFERDNYSCRYCGLPVIPKDILRAYSRCVGKEFFKDTGTNAERHGVVLAFRANADHVVPWTLGGKTEPSNLVSSCWSCNYGKAGYTLEELDLVDPRQTDVIKTEWDGLVSLKKGLVEN